MRARDFDLLIAARELFGNDSRFNELHECCTPLGSKGLAIYRSKVNGNVAAFELKTCGRVHLCAICSKRISYRRQKELARAFENHCASGGSLLQVTLTFAHYRDPLCETLPLLISAFNNLKERKTFRRNRKLGNFEYYSRRIEITYSFSTGFHPHIHLCLLWTEPKSETSAEFISEFREQLHQDWAGACRKVGLGEPSDENGVEVEASEDYETTSRYLMKSGFAARESDCEASSGEMSSSGLTIWNLLALYKQGDKRVEAPLLDYAEATFNRQTVRHSNNLLKAYGVHPPSDRQILASSSDWEALFEATTDEQALISRYHLQPKLIEAGRRAGEAGIRAILAEYRERVNRPPQVLIMPNSCKQKSENQSL